MLLLIVFTYAFTSIQTLLWTSSDWLISTVLPAVVVDLTNEARAANQLADLQHDSVLDRAAQLKAEHMAQNQYFAHHSPSGVTPWHWFAKAGYRYAHAGENLAVHFTDSGEVVEAWMESPTHRENIVNGRFTEIGVGTARGEFEGQRTIFVVQLFGTPAVRTAPVTTTTERSVDEMADSTTATTASSSLAAASSAAEAEADAETAPTTTTTPPNQPETDAQASTVLAEADPDASSQDDAPSSPTTSPRERALEERVVVVPSSTRATPSTSTPSTTNEVAATPTTSPTTMVVQDDQTVSLYTPTLATSSGLAPAPASLEPSGGEQSRWIRILGMLTQPQMVLQLLYAALGGFVLVTVVMSVVIEIRQQRPVQIAYGFGLLVLMSGLYYAHTAITAGVQIV